MKIVTISDTHGYHSKIYVPNGDIVVCAGDISSRGSVSSIQSFLDWYSELPHAYKILVPGNHDWGFEKEENLCKTMCEERGIIYLNNSGIGILGVKFWGTASQKPFCNWAFNHDVETRKSLYSLIPKDTDVLVLHGPPYGILDETEYVKENVGCEIVLDTIKQLDLAAVVFGHIHEARGYIHKNKVLYINTSICTLQYNPTNAPFVFSINGKNTRIIHDSYFKKCNQCNELQHLTEFYYRKDRGRYRANCKTCCLLNRNKDPEKQKEYRRNTYNKIKNDPNFKRKERNRRFVKRYGITVDDYDNILKSQAHCCKICGIHISQLDRRLCVDHNHDTGKVRGLLCDSCNTSLGKFEDNAELLKRAVWYLEDSESDDE